MTDYERLIKAAEDAYDGWVMLCESTDNKEKFDEYDQRAWYCIHHKEKVKLARKHR